MALTEDNWRLQGMRFFVTYKTHLNKAEAEQFYRNKCECEFWRAAHEHGKPTEEEPEGYKHTHVLVKFAKKVDWRGKACLDFWKDVPHCNVKPIKTNTHWKNELNYIAKEDPENADLLEEKERDEDWMAKLQMIKSKKELLDGLHYREWEGRLKAWLTAKSMQDNYQVRELEYEWQKEVAEMVEAPSSKREVIWIYDRKGGAGKSDLAEYLMDKGSDWVYLTGSGCNHLAHALSKHVHNGIWTGHGVVMDLSRNVEKWDGFYAFLEQVKNRKVFSSKYDSGLVRWAGPTHVLVFANWPPMKEEMSDDRWRIYHLDSIDRSLDRKLTRE